MDRTLTKTFNAASTAPRTTPTALVHRGYTEVEYRRNGVLHRDPDTGPAWMRTDEQGRVVTREEYWRDGKRHRDRNEGPAVIERNDRTGVIINLEFWENGIRISSTNGQKAPLSSPRR